MLAKRAGDIHGHTGSSGHIGGGRSHGREVTTWWRDEHVVEVLVL